MELLDRYLHEVKRYLPKGQKDDLAAEIGEDIASQVEDKQSAIGRPLSRDEEAELIKAYGHPKIIASRYGAQQYLIGPTLLPFYFYTLRIVGVILLVMIALAIAAHRGDALSSFAFAWGLFWNSAFLAIGLVTTIFAAIEYAAAKSGRSLSLKWDPRALPPAGQRKVPILQSVFELIFSLIFLNWLLDVPGVRALVSGLLGPGRTEFQHGPFRLGESLHTMLFALGIVAAVQIVVSIVNIVRPDWVRLRAAALVGTNAFLALALGSTLLRGQPYVVLADTAKHTADYATAAVALNAMALVFFIAWVIIDLILVVVNVRLLLQREERSLAPAR